MVHWREITELRRAKLQDCFLLYSTEKKFNKDNTGLYKGDRLGCFKANTGHQNDKIREELINKLNAI